MEDNKENDFFTRDKKYIKAVQKGKVKFKEFRSLDLKVSIEAIEQRINKKRGQKSGKVIALINKYKNSQENLINDIHGVKPLGVNPADFKHQPLPHKKKEEAETEAGHGIMKAKVQNPDSSGHKILENRSTKSISNHTNEC